MLDIQIRWGYKVQIIKIGVTAQVAIETFRGCFFEVCDLCVVMVCVGSYDCIMRVGGLAYN